MTEDTNASRRRFLAVSGTAAVGVGLSGCSFLGGSSSSNDDEEDDEEDSEGNGSGSGDTATTTTEAQNDAGGGMFGQGDITIGGTYQGEVTEGGSSDPEYDGYAEEVTFRGQSGQTVTITLESDAFDPMLVLYGPNGQYVAENDDTGAGFDSQLVLTLEQTGMYSIWATSWSGASTGSYTLTLEEGDQSDGGTTGDTGGAEDGPDLRQISLGQTRSGFIDNSDPSDPEYDGLAEPVTFQGQRGQTVTITMESGLLDTLLVLYGPNGSYVTENDDYDDSYNSQIVVELQQSGTYTIWATTYSGIGTGEYTLSLREGGQSQESGGSGSEDGPDLREISFGQTRSGFIDESDPRDPEYNGLAEPVTFQGQRGQTVTITMESDLLDTLLVLFGPNGYVTENDDYGGTYNSQIVTELPATGTYTIWAGTYSGFETGEYTLTLSDGNTTASL